MEEWELVDYITQNKFDETQNIEYLNDNLDKLDFTNLQDDVILKENYIPDIITDIITKNSIQHESSSQNNIPIILENNILIENDNNILIENDNNILIENDNNIPIENENIIPQKKEVLKNKKSKKNKDLIPKKNNLIPIKKCSKKIIFT
jgi:hypothetical protein